ncbi:MAG: endonuclease III [Candidatus Aegiribacteria sp.]
MSSARAGSVLRRMRDFLGELGSPAPLETSGDAFHVLVSTIVSLRTRDATTRKVSRQVLDRAPTPEAMAAIDRRSLEELLRPAGFFRQKAGQLRELSSILVRDFEGEVPDSMEELLSLPGVGRKTANFVLGMVFGIPAVCVDVHVHRISNRLGLVNTGSPEETEAELRELFPRMEWTGINHTMVRFGQRVCRPVKPACGLCPLAEECPGATKGEE